MIDGGHCMKKLSKGKVIIALVLTAVIALSTAIVIAPSADKNRVNAQYLTDISAENWVDESVYNDGTKITEISLNGTSVEAGFQFKTGDTITFNAPVNEDDAETPDDLFRKAEGVARLPTLMPFHNASPCPKRALKSPATTFPLLRFKSYRIYPHTVSGFNPRPS
jgi:hypothetical protein